MRPKEHLVRRNGNINNQELHKKLEEWSDRLGKWEEFWTAIVVFGLVIEYLPLILSIVISIEKHSKLLEQTGGLLVIIGVAGELLVSRRASSVETDLREISNAMLASALERAAKAEERAAVAKQSAAEANLARAKLEQRMAARFIDAPGKRELIELLSLHAGKTVDVVLFDHHIQETKYFGAQVRGIFGVAKWNCRLWESRAAGYRIPGTSLLIVICDGHFEEFKGIASAMAEIMMRSGIDCAVSSDKFSCKGEFTPGDFHLDGEHPGNSWERDSLRHSESKLGRSRLFPPFPITSLTLRRG
jgi:hypothetical protein